MPLSDQDQMSTDVRLFNDAGHAAIATLSTQKVPRVASIHCGVFGGALPYDAPAKTEALQRMKTMCNNSPVSSQSLEEHRCATQKTSTLSHVRPFNGGEHVEAAPLPSQEFRALRSSTAKFMAVRCNTTHQQRQKLCRETKATR